MEKIPEYLRKKAEDIFGSTPGFEPTEYEWIFKPVGSTGIGWNDDAIQGMASIKVRYTPKDRT